MPTPARANHFEDHERAVFDVDPHGQTITHAILDLHSNQSNYALQVEEIAKEGFPNLYCASFLLERLTLLNNTSMAQFCEITESNFRARIRDGKVGDPIGRLGMANRPASRLWLPSQKAHFEDPPWARGVLTHLKLTGLAGIATLLGIDKQISVRAIKALEEPRYFPITFIEADRPVAAWLPEQFEGVTLRKPETSEKA